jgi:Ca2+-binding RTX toxin-like protein
MVKLVHAYGLQDDPLASFYPEADVDLTTHSGKKAVLEFAGGYEIELIGKGLTYEGLAITGGQLETIVFRDAQGNAIASASNLKGFSAFNAYDVIVTQTGVDLHPFLFNGKDIIIGSNGDDMRGGESADMLNGGRGNDRLDSGNGNDVMIGGAGVDSFLGGAGSNRDTVRDFDAVGADHDWIINEGSGEATWAKDGADILITFDSGDTMRLLDVKRWQFSDDLIMTEIN